MDSNGLTTTEQQDVSDSKESLRGVDLNHRPLGYEPKRTPLNGSKNSKVRLGVRTDTPPDPRVFGLNLASSWGGRSKWLTREEVENDSSPTDGLTPLEHMIRDEMAFNGWYIIRGGWPDFLCITIDAEGNMHHVCLEAKCRSDKLSKSQRRMIMALESMGLPTYVVKNPREIRGILKDYIGRCPAPFVADDIRLDEEDWLG